MKRSMLLPMLILPVLANAQGQPSLVSVVFNPTTVTGGTSATATITISAPARQNGFDIALSLNSTIAQLQSSTITIGEGQSSQVVPVATNPVANQQVVILTASTRAETRSGALTIAPPSIASITVAPASVVSGEQTTATITLTGGAPSDGFPVSLSSSSPAISVPASVSVPSRQRTTNVTMTARTVGAQTSVTLTAGAGGISKTASLTVAPAPVSIVSLQYPSDPVSGAVARRTITLSGPAPTGGTIVRIATTGADILQLRGAPLADTVPAGQTSVTRSKAAPTTDTDRAFEITATLDGVSMRRSGTLRAPTIVSVSFADSLFEGSTIPLKANLSGTPPNSGLPVVITSSNPSAISSPGAVSGTYADGSISYPIRANDVSVRTPVTLSVEREGTVRRLSTTVIPRVPVLTNFTVTPFTVTGGQSVTITATLDGPAPPGGTAVVLRVFPGLNNFAVPDTLLIRDQATSGTVTVATPRLPFPVSVEVSASLNTVRRVMLRINAGCALFTQGCAGE